MNYIKPTKDLGRHQGRQYGSVSQEDLGVILVGARSKLWSGINMCGGKDCLCHQHLTEGRSE